MRNALIIGAAAMSFVAAAADAASVSPVSYDMLNGNSGSYNYWDKNYTGSGATMVDNAALAGGTGDLTDGVIASGNWNIEEPPVGGNGPYVGWTLDPSITFRFASVLDFNSITFHFDDADGAGGVAQPGSVTVNGASFAVPTHAGPSPFAFTIDLTGTSTDTLSTQIFRTGAWVFLSEVTFDADVSAVPLPAGGLLLVGGLGALAGLRRRSRKG